MRRNSWSAGNMSERRTPLAKPTSLQVVILLIYHYQLGDMQLLTCKYLNYVDTLYGQDFKRLLAQQTPREPRVSAGHQLGISSSTTTSQSVPTYRELQKSGSMKKMGTPWRFSIIQEEPERGRSEEELSSRNIGPTDL